MSSLDYVYILDATGSQQRYINRVRDEVVKAADDIRGLADVLDNRPDALRLRLIAFRDHGSDFVVKAGDFTSDVKEFQDQVKALFAFGGRDGPEAQADALAAAVDGVQWGANASKVVTLVTDSPPHGIKAEGDTYEDEYPDGCPDGNDLDVIKQMFLDEGIIFNVWACEPTLSKTYKNAETFYKSWTNDTGGDYSQLDKTGLHLKLAMVGTGLKALDTNRLAKELGPKIVSQAHLPAEAIAANLHRELSAQGIQHYQLHSTDASVKSAEVDKNIATWSTAGSFKEARSKIVAIPGDRLLPQYRDGNDIKISYSKEPITRENVDNIVALALRQAKADTPAEGVTPKKTEAPKQDIKKTQGDKKVDPSVVSQAMRLMGRK